jgi:hypothetical protein
MKKIFETAARNSKSESFKKLNPHLFTHSQFDVKVKQPEMLRQNKTCLNKLETEYLQILRAQFGDCVSSQSLTVKIGNGCRYTPDFIVWNSHGCFAYEVKGFMRDDAAVKIKVAAKLFPLIEFRIVWKTDGRWMEQKILP